MQAKIFKTELKEINDKGYLNKQSHLVKLQPFLDKNGIMRVGGRIDNSLLNYDTRHPIILPSQNHVTNIIIDYYHLSTLHGGAQLVLNTIRSKGYWIINGMHSVKSRIFKCPRCTRFRGQNSTQIMGDLPEVRVRPARAFQNVGLDYAGPIEL